MADSGLFALYKLHLVDSALYDLKQHAAALDIGREELKKIKELEADPEGVLTESRRLSAELKDLELQQKTFDDKIKKLESDLYSGKIVNPREVAAIEKDKASIREQNSKIDERILELWEIVPPAKAAAAGVEGQIAQLRAAIAEKEKAAKEEHVRLQAAFKAKSAERAPKAKAVDPMLLEQYEKLRAKLDVGMAMVTPDNRCGTCGMHVPPKAIVYVGEDKVVQCENCRRILFRLQQG